MTPVADLQEVFRQMPALALLLRPDFTIAAASNAYLQAANLSGEAIWNRNFFDVFPDENDEGSSIRQSLHQILHRHEVIDVPPRKYGFRAKDGSAGVKYWRSTTSPICDSSGRLIFILRIVEDVTVDIHQENEHHAAIHERDVFFASSFDLMAIVGTDGYFKRLSPSFKRTLGYEHEELCARPLVEFLHPDDRSKTKRGIKTLSSGLPTIESLNRYRCKNGDYKWISWNTTPVGEFFYSVGRDITDRVAAEEKIRDLNAALEIRNEDLEAKVAERMAELRRSEAQVQQLQKMDAIGRLAGGIAHDFNNMLGAISLYCDILTECAHNPNAVKEAVQDIVAATSRASALTRQLLIFSRKQIVQPQTIVLNPLIESMQKMLRRLIGANVSIAANLAADLNPINADASQIEQVILNLVVNARDAMPQGGTLTVETANVYLDETFTSTHLSATPGHYVMLSVADTGVGMDAATLSRVFEPFFTTKEVGKGTGLGLTTIYGIVKQNQGTIWVYSELGRGTMFKIYLPISHVTTAEPSIPEIQLHDVKGWETILLVEDDDHLRTGYASMLRERGYQVLVVNDGSRALELIKNHPGPIHLLLTDVILPGQNGFELFKKSTQLRPELRVLFMSGYTDDTFTDDEVPQFLARVFIQKPFSFKGLLAKVREVLSLSADYFAAG